MRTLAIAAFALATIATPAFAQDQASGDKPSFTGAYVGIGGGLDHVGDSTDSATGVTGVLDAGYDFQSSNLVFGIEGEAGLASTKDCTGGACVKAGRDLYIGGRVGVLASENVLIYAKAGYTNAKVKGTAGGTTVVSDTLDGIRGGVGVEATTNGRLFGRLEYRYSNYESDVVRHQGVVTLGVRF